MISNFDEFKLLTFFLKTELKLEIFIKQTLNKTKNTHENCQ